MRKTEIEISVVIFSYNKTEYIERAVRSVMFQDFNKSKYEVLIIKNFPNKEEWNSEVPKVRQFCKDGTIGDFIETAIKQSEGGIICFLDDDDWFAPDELNEISRYFTEYEIGYLHDTPLIVAPGKKIVRSALQSDIYVSAASLNRKKHHRLLSIYADGMMSSISIRREILQDINEKPVTGPDYFIFYLSIARGYGILASSKKLTYYLYHETSNKFPVDIKEQIRWRKNMVTYTTSNYANLLKYSENPLLRRQIQWNFLAFSINLKLILPDYKILEKDMLRLILYSNTLKQVVRSLFLTSGVIMQKVFPTSFHKLFNHDILNRIGFI